MLEGSCRNIPVAQVEKAITTGVHECQNIISAIEELAKSVGKEKFHFEKLQIQQEILEDVRNLCENDIRDIFSDSSYNKTSRNLAVQNVYGKVKLTLASKYPSSEQQIAEGFQSIVKTVFRNLILDKELRCDGRDFDELRPILCESNVYPSLHGSSVFTRGQTQVACTVSFDSTKRRYASDPLVQATGGDYNREFMVQYEFPAYATGDITGPTRGPNRREIGHGALAERALRQMLPSNLPFTVLINATVLESNGSSSMGTVCAGSMALFDAGVKMSSHVAGVAMGLVTEMDSSGKIVRYRHLVDISGMEDQLGDMDFKIAGTREGITALQADIKLPGLLTGYITQALYQSNTARRKIINLMRREIEEPRQSKPTWPVTSSILVSVERRSKLMGLGGMVLRKVQESTGAELWWEEDELHIFAPNRVMYEEALETVTKILDYKEPTLEFGAIYTARVVEVKDFGVTVELYDGMKPELLPLGQLDIKKVQHPRALGIEAGQSIKVKYFGRDPDSGKMRLSRRAILAHAISDKDLIKAGTSNGAENTSEFIPTQDKDNKQ